MGSIFLYGSLVEGGADHAWVHDLPTRRAWVRGRLWSGPRRRVVLLPDPEGDPVAGVLVDLPAARVPVLDLLLGGNGVGLRPVQAAVGLRPAPVRAWALDGEAAARRGGWRPLRAPEGRRR